MAASHRLLPGCAQPLPALLHGLQGGTRGRIARHRQRPSGIALFQQGQAGVELADQQGQALRARLRQGLRQLPGLHAHPPRFIDRRSPPFERPGQPQGQANRDQRHQQQRATNGADLDGQRPLACWLQFPFHGPASG